MNNKKFANIMITMPGELADRIKEEAKAQHLTTSAWARLVFYHYFEK